MQRSLKFEINPATLLVLIIGAAAVLRGYNLMHGSGAHPDERHIIMVTSGFSWSNLNPKSFAYGSLPFYLVWFCAQLLQLFGYQANYDHLFVVGRSLAVIFGVCAVYLTYRIALKLFEKHSIALLAAAFLAFNPFHLQLSRFCTVDIFLTTFALACISALIDFAKAGRIRDAMFAALFFGLSLGTKISALSLLVPLITALLAAKAKRPEKSGIGLFALLSLILPISLLICFLVQPYAFWDWQVFMAHTNEQINMVRGNWRPPYTIQYLGTLPYLYPLEQIFKYTMGWPVALICCAGVLLSLFRILQRPLWPTLLKLEAIPLGWLFAVYISVGGMDVKFPRYLLPLYPLLCIFGAQLLIEMSSKLRPALLRPIPALLVTVHAVIFGLAFVTIYRPDHAYTKASEWVFANVPAGARLLGVHWDDKLPVTLPGHDAQQYQMWSPENELPLYEHDTAQKMRMVAERMAASDYLIFPTARTYGSIPKMPESFPATIYFLKLLFAEKLGYKLVYTLREQPSFGSFVFPDDLADESISVYDHPRVTVFKNEARMSADQILAAVRPMTDSPELPGLREMLLHTAPPTFGHEEFLLNQGWYQLLQFLAWFAVIQLLGLAAFPFVAMCLPKNRDGGYGYSKIIGLGVFGILAAALNLTGVLQLKLIHLWALLLILMLGSHLFVLGYFRSWGALVASRRKFIIGNEISFCCAFLVFTILRIFNPEIFWGEKPMDFGMLNYFLRLEDLPPKDPWAAQQPLNYYYLGILLSAIIHKLSGVSSAIGYHLSLVTIFAFYLSAAYSIIIFLGQRRGAAAWGAWGVTLLANFAVVQLAFIDGRGMNFDLFWASSRTFTSPAFSEYPLWALLFGDLHAHVISLPFCLTVLGLGLAFLESGRFKAGAPQIFHPLLYGLLLASLSAINTWDFITFSAVTVLVLTASGLGRRPLPTIGRWLEYFLSNQLSRLFLIALSAIFVLLIFKTGAGVKLHFGWNQALEFNQAWHILLHFGPWLVLLVPGLVLLTLRRLGAGWRIVAWSFLVALIPIILGSWASMERRETAPWSILGSCSVLLFLGNLALSGSVSRSKRALNILLSAALLIIAFAEMVFLFDRMNTIFKFYNPVWGLIGISAVILVAMFLRSVHLMRSRILSWALYLVGGTFFLVGLSLGLAGTLINTQIMTTFQRVTGPRPTLNGMAYLPLLDGDEAHLVFWLRQNMNGTPTMVEAWGQSYGPFTRVNMNTGIPSLLGWEYHVIQRGLNHAQAVQRKDDIHAIYSSAEPYLAYQAAQRNNVDFIVVSNIEKNTYPAAGIAKFERAPELFPVLFRQGDVRVYGITDSRAAKFHSKVAREIIVR